MQVLFNNLKRLMEHAQSERGPKELEAYMAPYGIVIVPRGSRPDFGHFNYGGEEHYSGLGPVGPVVVAEYLYNLLRQSGPVEPTVELVEYIAQVVVRGCFAILSNAKTRGPDGILIDDEIAQFLPLAKLLWPSLEYVLAIDRWAAQLSGIGSAKRRSALEEAASHIITEKIGAPSPMVDADVRYVRQRENMLPVRQTKFESIVEESMRELTSNWLAAGNPSLATAHAQIMAAMYIAQEICGKDKTLEILDSAAIMLQGAARS